jgi:ketosteroid isomerase-like protein
MSSNKTVVDRFWDLFESNRLAELPDLFHSDCHFRMPGMEVRGGAAVLQLLSAYRAAFPDLRHVVKHSIESGETIAVELVATGTHTGPMQTPQGTVPPTGNTVVWESCDYIAVRGGKIASWHVYHDTVPFLTALGLLPKP